MSQLDEVFFCLVVFFIAAISLDEPPEEAISFSLVLGFLVAVVLEVYRFPKKSIPVEEDLKKLDEKGYLKDKKK